MKVCRTSFVGFGVLRAVSMPGDPADCQGRRVQGEYPAFSLPHKANRMRWLTSGLSWRVLVVFGLMLAGLRRTGRQGRERCLVHFATTLRRRVIDRHAISYFNLCALGMLLPGSAALGQSHNLAPPTITYPHPLHTDAASECGDFVSHSATAGADCGWSALGTGMNGGVWSFEVYNGELIAGGEFTTAGSTTVNHIARRDDVSATWQPLSTGMAGATGSHSSGVWALVMYNGDLIAGGNFTTAGGVTVNRIARWDGETWHPLGSGMNNTVAALTVYNNDLIAAGHFTSAGGVSANRIARWNGASWQPLGSGLTNRARSLVVYNGHLVVGGWFGSAGGVSGTSGIASWNGSSWQSIGGGVSGGPSLGVAALAENDGNLIAAGDFTTAGSIAVNRIARWDGSSWHALATGMNGWIENLTVYDGNLVAGGSFTTAGGVGANYIARWDGSSWSVLGSGMNDAVWALTVFDDGSGPALYAGGWFTTAGGNASARIAKWQGACPRQECLDATGDCFSVGSTPGCEDPSCCESVCAADEFCCNIEWDELCVDQATQLCDAPPTTVFVTAGAAYDPDAPMLSISARAFDAAVGQYLQDGTASYFIPERQDGGTLSYVGYRWTAVADFSGDPPPPGNYVVNVHIAGGMGQAPFHVPGLTGTVRGAVYDAADQPFEGITVSLHESLAHLDTALFATQSGPDGEYEVTGLPPGWYIIRGAAEGFFAQNTGIRVSGGTVVEKDFSLTAARTLRNLDAQMRAFYREVLLLRFYTTDELSLMTGQAANHFRPGIDGWDIASAVSSLVAGTLETLGPDAFKGMTSIEMWSKAKPVLEKLILRFRFWLPPLLFEGHDLLLANTIKTILPDNSNEWRRYNQAELLATGSATEGRATLEEAWHEYLALSESIVVTEDFRFPNARIFLSDLTLQLRRIREGEPIRTLVPPQSEPPFKFVSFPSAVQVWKLNHAVLSFVGGSKKIAITVKLISDGALLLGAGTTAPVAGTLSAGARVANLVLTGAEVTFSWLGGLTYALNVKAWGEDMLTVPSLFDNTWEFLKQEAVTPTFLAGSEPFKVNVTFDLNEHGTILGVPFIVTDSVRSLTANGLATIEVTNNSALDLRIRASTTSYWDAWLPGNVPGLRKLFGNVSQVRLPINTNAGFVDIAPGQTRTLFIPYMGIYVPINVTSIHWFIAEVYSGPFVVRTFPAPFQVVPGSFAGAAQADAPVFGTTFLENGNPDSITAGASEVLGPDIALLGEETLTPDEPVFETVYDATNVPALEFQMHSDSHGVVELRVCDKLGRCVGYDSSMDGVVTEFPAVHSGDASTSQRVSIPSPDADAYTVRAVLTGAVSEQPVRVSLWAIETPERPAVMGVAPFAYTSRLYWYETATVPLSIGEAGGQIPLTGVSVSVGDVIGPDGVSALSIVEGGEQAFSLIPAGTSEAAEVRIDIPRGAVPGMYQGIITVVSENAGVQEGLIELVVLPPGDLNADGIIDRSDVARIFGDKAGCVWGPAIIASEFPCGPADFDGDEFIDLHDIAAFQNWISEHGLAERRPKRMNK